jgi:hypothetical protein
MNDSGNEDSERILYRAGHEEGMSVRIHGTAIKEGI